MKKVFGFAPDAEQTTPGALQYSGGNFIPTESGIAGAPAPNDMNVDLPAACRGIDYLVDDDGQNSGKVVAGTASKLYFLDNRPHNSSSWTDRSRAGDYTLAADSDWSFATFFGSVRLAAQVAAVIQRSVSGGAFANVAGSPQARIIVSASGFILAFNTTVSQDQWYCSAYLDPTDWAVSVSTQCTSGQLLGTAGPITAAKAFGDDVVAYKSNAIYVGRYVGAPEVWRWRQVSTDVGCVGGIAAVAETPIGHVFMSSDGPYVFDGTTPRPLGDGTVREWLRKSYQPAGRSRIVYDKARALVWIFYPETGTNDGYTASSNGEPNRALVMHVKTGHWGIINGIASQSGTGGTLAAGVFSYADSTASGIGFIDDSENYYLMNAANSSAYLYTGFYGSSSQQSDCSALLAETKVTATSTATGYYGALPARAGVSTGATTTLTDGKYDMRQNARWHTFKVNFSAGDWELTGLTPKLIPAGRR